MSVEAPRRVGDLIAHYPQNYQQRKLELYLLYLPAKL